MLFGIDAVHGHNNLVGSTLFPAITKQNWQVGCVAQAANDATREAFLVVSPDGKFIAAVRGDWVLVLWDATSGKSELTLNAHDGPVFGAVWSPDGAEIASGGQSSIVYIWNVG